MKKIQDTPDNLQISKNLSFILRNHIIILHLQLLVLFHQLLDIGVDLALALFPEANIALQLCNLLIQVLDLVSVL